MFNNKISNNFLNVPSNFTNIDNTSINNYNTNNNLNSRINNNANLVINNENTNSTKKRKLNDLEGTGEGNQTKLIKLNKNENTNDLEAIITEISISNIEEKFNIVKNNIYVKLNEIEKRIAKSEIVLGSYWGHIGVRLGIVLGSGLALWHLK